MQVISAAWRGSQGGTGIPDPSADGEDMPGKSLNEGTDTWNGKQPLRRIQKQILSGGPTEKTGKGNMPDAHAGVT
jgi:hypothetical protein